MKLAKRPCMACGRVIAVRLAIQNEGGGKARQPHKCPHGRPCITGDKMMGGQGFNYAPTVGPYKCRECNQAKFNREQAALARCRELGIGS